MREMVRRYNLDEKHIKQKNRKRNVGNPEYKQSYLQRMAQQNKDSFEEEEGSVSINTSSKYSKMKMTGKKTTNRFPVEDPYF